MKNPFDYQKPSQYTDEEWLQHEQRIQEIEEENMRWQDAAAKQMDIFYNNKEGSSAKKKHPLHISDTERDTMIELTIQSVLARWSESVTGKEYALSLIRLREEMHSEFDLYNWALSEDAVGADENDNDSPVPDDYTQDDWDAENAQMQDD